MTIKVVESAEMTPESKRDPVEEGGPSVKLPRMTIREAIAWVAVVALAIAWVSKTRKARTRDIELGVLRARVLDPCP